MNNNTTRYNVCILFSLVDEVAFAQKCFLSLSLLKTEI